jgi:hypothetical protein
MRHEIYMKTKLIFLALLAFFCVQDVFSQGCGDAGFCTIEGIKQNENVKGDSLVQDSAFYKNTIKAGLSLGNTRYGVWIINPYLTYSRQLNKNITASVKLDGQYRTGMITQVIGFSDITLSFLYKIHPSFGVIVGGKIPLTDANKLYKGNSMPMAYQTGLGTYDAIAGVQYGYKKLFMALGWQQPLIQNSSSFLFKNHNIFEALPGPVYPETNKYIRSADVLLRISYNHKPKTCLKKFSFTYSLLPIYHLNNDRYTNEDNMIVEIKDSKGLTLNTNIFANYSINDKTAFQLSTGVPVLARKVRPDGLSQFALTMEWVKKF